MTTKEAYAIARSLNFPYLILSWEPPDIIRQGEASWSEFRMIATTERWQRLFARLEHWQAYEQCHASKEEAVS